MKTENSGHLDRIALFIVPVSLVILLLVFGFVTKAWFDKKNLTDISPGENGKCSQKLVDYMEEQYGIFIPENAVFVGGYFDNAFRDPAFHVAFDVKCSDMPGWYEGITDKDMLFCLTKGRDLFSSEAVSGVLDSISKEWKREYSETARFKRSDGGTLDYIAFSQPKDGVISFYFKSGDYGASFR